MKFAIRDDDINFWTNVEEIDTIYREIWAKGIKVSFAVIPFSVRSFNSGDRNKFYQNKELMPIGKNKEIVEYLRNKIKKNR